MDPLQGKVVRHPSTQVGADVWHRWDFTNSTQTEICDFHFNTNRTYGDDPDLRGLRIASPDESITYFSDDTFPDVTNKHVTLKPCIPVGASFKILIKFNEAFEDDETIEILPSDSDGAVIEGPRASEIAALNTQIAYVASTTPTPVAGGTAPITSGIAPVTSDSSSTSQPGGAHCCTPAEEDAELRRMLSLYAAAVNNARASGYQAGNDPGYSDPGLGFHKVGNCADWAQVSWAALVVRTWRCWRVQKIRARQHWTVFGFHHFVRLEAPCSGRVYFLDPWKSGKPEFWIAAEFPCADGIGWAHTPIRTHEPGAAPRDPGND